MLIKTKATVLFAIVAILAAVLLSEIAGFTHWLSGIRANLSAQNKNTLVMCILDDPAGFDVARYVEEQNLRAAGPIFNKLVSFKEGTSEVSPSLATHWTVSSDHRTYTFYLRKSVKFHTTAYFKPTRDFNAQDVVFTFTRMLDPKHPFRVAYPAEFPLFVSVDMDKNIKTVQKVNDYTVQFVLRKPKVTFLQNLAKEFGAILSAEYADQLLKEGKAAYINQQPIGTGPFAFKSHVKTQKVHYVPHRDYWDKSPDGRVQLDHLIFAINNESIVHGKKMEAGECHMGEMDHVDLPKFKKNPEFIVHTEPGTDLWYIAYNIQKPILKKLAVRKALDMALNRADLVKSFNGMAKVAVNMMPPAQWPYNTLLKNTPYDPLKAKALLKEAGYPNGFTLRFFVSWGGEPTKKRVVEMIQRDWKKVGVHVQIISYEVGEFWQHVDRGDHDVVLGGWMGIDGDPDNWFGNLLSCESAKGGFGNHSRWCFKPFDQLIVQARQTSDSQARERLYKRAQQIFKDEIPFSPLYHTLAASVYHKSVQFKRSYIIPFINPEQFTGILMK